MRTRRIQIGLLLMAEFFVVGTNWEKAMAQDRGQGRSMVISQGGIVATESPLASKAGAAILERGGNAVDAAIAAHAVMTVVAPVWNGIGGDLFAIVYDAKSGKYYGLNASGWAPAAQSVERLRQKGLREMPARGIEPVTVPGSVDGWQKLLDRFGKKKMNEVLAPAIQVAEDGYPVTEWIAQHFTSNVDLLRDNEAAAKTFLISDRAPRLGEVMHNPDLAWSLRQIAQGGRDAFYQGEITKRILALSARHGGTLAAKDFSEYSSEWVEPISTTYRGWTVYEMPPNVQGIGALEMLNLMEQFDLRSYGLNSTRALHVQIEAKKLAYADVLRYIADPKTAKMPVSGMLSKDYAAKRAKLIDMQHANCEVASGHAGSLRRRHDVSERRGSRRQHGFVHRIELLGIWLGAGRRRHRIRAAQSWRALQPGSGVAECASPGTSGRCTRSFRRSWRRTRFASRSASWADGTRRRRTRNSCRTSWISIRTFRRRWRRRDSRS